MNRSESYTDYVRWLESLPPEAFRPANGADTLVTYSGRGGANRELAAQAVAADPENKYSLNQTPAGAALAERDLYENPSDLRPEEVQAIWRLASQKAMEHATVSKMETFVVDAKHDEIFRGTELSAALANSRIKTVNGVPCMEHMGKYEPSRIHESVCRAELALGEQRVAETGDSVQAQSLDERKQSFEGWLDRGDIYDAKQQRDREIADANFLARREASSHGDSPREPPPPELPPALDPAVPSTDNVKGRGR